MCFNKRTVANALLPVLRAEREHLNRPEVIRRPRESEVRATCGELIFVSFHFKPSRHSSTG